MSQPAVHAALAMMAGNHPGIMQTSAEQLCTLLGNIVSDPAEKKFRKLKPTNRLMAEKVLPAKGARPLLLAVGFEQSESHAVLIMQGCNADVGLLNVAIEGLQRLLGEKAERCGPAPPLSVSPPRPEAHAAGAAIDPLAAAALAGKPRSGSWWSRRTARCPRR